MMNRSPQAPMKIRLTYLLFSFLALCAYQAAWSQDEFDSLLIREIVVQNPVYKPVLGFGAGITNFYGDVQNNYINNMVGKYGFRATISTYLDSKKSLLGNFHLIYGSLTGNERDLDNLERNLNFQSNIMVFGLNLEYNFAHFFTNQEPVLRPFVSAGIENLSFDSKGDLYNKLNDSVTYEYNYWSDGTIRNIAENRKNLESNITLARDWRYETDLRQLQGDEFENYSKNTFAIPVDLGVDFHVTDRVTMRLGTSLHLTFSDFIDNVGWEGTKVTGDFTNDNFSYTYLTMHLDLFSPPRVITEELLFAELGEYDYDMFDDEDADGVFDISDDCPGTPPGIEVDTLGCPYDDDDDGVPNYLDREKDTPAGAFVDDEGIRIDEDELIALVNFPDAVPRSQLHLYLEGAFADADRMTLSEMPEKFHSLDLNADGYLSFNEMLSSIDAFFDFQSELGTEDVYSIINFFFKQ